MSLAAALARAPRCLLVNIATAESVECLFNPVQLVEKVAVNWNRLVVPGLSHQILQFQSTGNRQFAGVEFYVSRFYAMEQPSDVDILTFRAFLRALTVPSEESEGVSTTAPARVLFLWPNVLTMECVVSSVEFLYKQLAADGAVLVYTASVTFEEVLDTRITSEALREELA